MHAWNQARLAWYLRFGRPRSDAGKLIRELHHVLQNGTDAKTERVTGTDVGRYTDEGPAAGDELSSSIVKRIEKDTETANRNNITRTRAYIEFYNRHPEVHWALLAHCVSRNGGWSMTDTKGEWFKRTADNEQAHQFFSFLERSNWLIFHDAYPQLLLYEHSVNRQQNLSFLLPRLGVSRFMQVIWKWFWQTRDSSLLTRALIVNEQNYIETRVVRNAVYQKTVEASTAFQIPSWFNLNQVLIPYRAGNEVRLTGTTVRHFTSIDDRIKTGLRLYHALYQDTGVHAAIVDFMTTVRHRATREDYWPESFSSTAVSMETTAVYEPKIEEAGRGVSGSDQGTARSRSHKNQAAPHRKVFSPVLTDVWPDVHHRAAEPGDWFADLAHTIYLFLPIKPLPCDITKEYRRSIQTIEQTLQMKEKAQNFLSPTR